MFRCANKVLSRNFRFAFRLRTSIRQFASAHDLFRIGSRAKDPVVCDTAFAGTKKPGFAVQQSDSPI